MSTPALIMWAVVLAVGITASWRNPTALALSFAWLACETVWLVTGNSLPLSAYFMADIFVIAVVLGKAIVSEGCRTYPTLRDQLKCGWQALTFCDRAIVGLYLFAAWPVYISTLHPYYAWWALWCVTISQFLLAGGEAFARFREARREAAKPTPILDKHLVVIQFPVNRRNAEAARTNLVVKAKGYG